MIKSVIFDLDGVIIDSEPLWKEAEKAIFKTVGIDMTTEMCNITMGYRTDEVVKYWHEQHPWHNKSQEQVKMEMIEIVEKLIMEKGEPMPGVKESIKLFQSKGYKLGIASSSMLRTIKVVVNKFGLIDNFEAICSAEFEEYGKPHPAVYIKAASALETDPMQCIAIEDSFHGAIAAKAAKMKVIAIPDPSYTADKNFDFCDLVLTSLEDFNEAKLNALIN